MKLSNIIDIAKLVESFYLDNYPEYGDLFESISTSESNSNRKLNLSEFQHIASECVKSNDIIVNGEIIECLYLIYNWYKYRLIYSIKNPDKTISQFNDKVSSDIVSSKFFDTFFIEYDFTNSKYVGVFVDISKSQISLGFVKKENKFWNIEPIVLSLDYTAETDAYQAYVDYLSNSKYYSGYWKNQLDKILLCNVIASKPEITSAASYTLRIIRAIMQGYQNSSNNSNQTHTNIVTHKQDNETKVIKSHIRKKQLIIVETKISDFIKDYEVYPTSIAGTPKSPHPRREHIRKIKDSSPLGYHEVKVKSTIVHKDHYKKTTEKIVK